LEVRVLPVISTSQVIDVERNPDKFLFAAFTLGSDGSVDVHN